MKILNTTLKSLNGIISKYSEIAYKTEICQKNMLELKQMLNRYKTNNIDAYLVDMFIYPNSALKNYQTYLAWCKKYNVKNLSEKQFSAIINKKIKPIEVEEYDENDIFYCKIQSFIKGCFDKGNSIKELKKRLRNYILQEYPKAKERDCENCLNYITALRNLQKSCKNIVRSNNERN